LKTVEISKAMIHVANLKQEYQSKSSIYFQSDRLDMLPYVPDHATKILEVGCGYGNFGKLLKAERHVEVWGVELDEQAAKVATEKLDQVICAAFDRELGLPPNSFDCIIFNDVLEHLVDPFDALRYCKMLLREQGVVVASIPNVRYFYNMVDLLVLRKWEYADQGILDRTHLRFFTHSSILSTFSRLDYDIQTIEGLHPVEKMSLPGKYRYFGWLLWLFRDQIEDMRYLQFAVVASSK
jgi:2-polyprenyl-3-methyl-5-hydroxy-6-metoxy-1,4-benzoquinol methylase